MEKMIKYTIAIDIEEKNDKFFRYSYTKCWNEGKAKIIAILFNPSKATLTRNDTTLDFLTEHFLDSYGGIVVLNLFSFMCSNPINLINTEDEYEIKNWGKLMGLLEENKDSDFFIGWGTNFKNVEKRSNEYIKKNNISDSEKQNIIKSANNIEKCASKKKDELEKFFVKNNMEERIYCFWSYTKNKKSNKALHPSTYDRCGKNWTYDKYF